MDDAETAPDHASRIAQMLGEKEPRPLATIRRLVEAVGVAFAEELARTALEIQAGGGEALPAKPGDDGEPPREPRQRTLGGIFFRLARAHVPSKLKGPIFYDGLPNPHKARPPKPTGGEVAVSVEKRVPASVGAVESGQSKNVSTSARSAAPTPASRPTPEPLRRPEPARVALPPQLGSPGSTRPDRRRGSESGPSVVYVRRRASSTSENS
jgi:hypothetical protein